MRTCELIHDGFTVKAFKALKGEKIGTRNGELDLLTALPIGRNFPLLHPHFLLLMLPRLFLISPPRLAGRLSHRRPRAPCHGNDLLLRSRPLLAPLLPQLLLRLMVKGSKLSKTGASFVQRLSNQTKPLCLQVGDPNFRKHRNRVIMPSRSLTTPLQAHFHCRLAPQRGRAAPPLLRTRRPTERRAPRHYGRDQLDCARAQA